MTSETTQAKAKPATNAVRLLLIGFVLGIVFSWFFEELLETAWNITKFVAAIVGICYIAYLVLKRRS